MVIKRFQVQHFQSKKLHKNQSLLRSLLDVIKENVGKEESNGTHLIRPFCLEL